MLTKFLDSFRNREDSDPNFIRLTRNILFFTMAANLAILPIVGGIIGEGTETVEAFLALAATFAIEILAFLRLRRGDILIAKLVVPIALVIAVAAIAYSINGIRDTSLIAMPLILVISAILLGERSLTIITPLAVIAAVAIAVRDLYIVKVPEPIEIDDAIIVPILLATTAIITHLLIRRLNESILRAQASEQMQRQENAELNRLRAGLEERVRDRTAELEKANQITERQARQFKAVAQVMSAVSSVQSLDELLPLITRVISQQFGVYHVGIFLLDDKKESAVLRATNSDGGQRMLARKHSLPVGQAGLVGFVTATGLPRIASNVGEDSAYFNNPDLPSTRSEITLPLRYGNLIIGALDVQSTEPNAFLPSDVDVLTTLADQVAVAINNAQNLAESQRALAEAESAVGRYAQEAWQVLRPTELGIGFSYSESGIKSLQHPVENPQVNEAIARGEAVLTTGPGNWSRLAIPIRLRGKVIGVMQLTSRGDSMLTSDDAEIAQGVAERLSLAIETATLLQSSQHRADLEKVTANITSKISSSTRFDTILQTAARELSIALGGSDVIVQIEPASLKMDV